MTTRHPDNSPPLQLVTMAYMPGSFSLFWLFFISMFPLYTAPRIFHLIFCRFFVLINEIQHLLLHFNYVIFIYIKIVILYWRNVMVASCKVASCKVASCKVASCTGIFGFAGSPAKTVSSPSLVLISQSN
jgi:hypothetical protein